jgi:hypothetical protein
MHSAIIKTANSERAIAVPQILHRTLAQADVWQNDSMQCSTAGTVTVGLDAQVSRFPEQSCLDPCTA